MDYETKLRGIDGLYDMSLTPWCRIYIDEYDKQCILVRDLGDAFEYDWFMKRVVWIDWSVETTWIQDFENLWHPLTIGRVMQWGVYIRYDRYVQVCWEPILPIPLPMNIITDLAKKRWLDLSLTFDKLPEQNQKDVYEFISQLSKND
jgi:hypothetical protein